MPVNYDKISVSTESTSVKCKIAFPQPIRKGRGKLLFSVRQMPPEAMFTFSSHTDGLCQIPKRCSWEMLGVSHHCLQSRRLFVQLPRKQLLSNTKAINIYKLVSFHQGLSHKIRSYKNFSNILFKRL